MSLPMMTLPSYEVFLPGLNKKVKYRPFTVKEEKNLMIALQEDNFEAAFNSIKELLDVCTYKELKVDDLAQIDAELLFINIRNKSMGEGVDVVSSCVKCEHKTYLTLNLGQYEVINPQEKINSTIQLDKTTWIKMKYPTLSMGIQAIKEDEYQGVMSVLSKCLDTLIVGEKSYYVPEFKQEEVVKWLESLSQEQMNKISEFLEKIPQIVFKDKYTCSKCGHENEIEMRGLEAFFE